jgi:divalent metal cation (Fe/Co/Zn/Cd) transporter
MDRSAEPEIRARILDIASAVDDVRAVEKVIVRRAGTDYFADLHVHADPAMSLRDAHVVSGKVKSAIRTRLPNVRGVLVHMEPSEE